MGRILGIFAIISLFLCLVTPINSQDYVLQIVDPVDLNCISIFAGTTLVLERGEGMSACNADVNILKDGDPTFFRSADKTFSVSFLEPGEYIVYCGAPELPSFDRRFASTAACFTVLPQVVPAMEEWGLIILGLLLLITSVLYLKNSSTTIPSVG